MAPHFSNGKRSSNSGKHRMLHEILEKKTKNSEMKHIQTTLTFSHSISNFPEFS